MNNNFYKSFSGWAMSLFNALPSDTKLNVFNENKFTNATKIVAEELVDLPYIVPFKEDSLEYQVKNKTRYVGYTNYPNSSFLFLM